MATHEKEDNQMPALSEYISREVPVLPLTTTIQKWGNSLAVRIPKEILNDSNLKKGTHIEFKKLADGNILIIPQKNIRKKYSLDELLAQCKEENRPEVIDFGIEGEELI